MNLLYSFLGYIIYKLPQPLLRKKYLGKKIRGSRIDLLHFIWFLVNETKSLLYIYTHTHTLFLVTDTVTGPNFHMNPSTVKVAVKWSKFFCHFYAPFLFSPRIYFRNIHACIHKHIYTHTHTLPAAFQRKNREAPPGMPHLFYSPLKHFFPFPPFFFFFVFLFAFSPCNPTYYSSVFQQPVQSRLLMLVFLRFSLNSSLQ